MNAYFRNTLGATDAEALVAVHHACHAVEPLDPLAEAEYRPTADWYGAELRDGDPRDWVVAEVNGEVVGYGHALWSWGERDGTLVHLHLGWVKPRFRGRGIWSELVARLEARCREQAVRDGHSERLEIAANASETEQSAQRLLLDHGYFVGYTMLNRRLDPLSAADADAPLPEGYDLRRVLPEHHLAVWQCIGDAYEARNIRDISLYQSPSW